MNALRSARKLRSMSQVDLASMVGVTQGHISSLETMDERASAALAEKIVVVLGRDLITEEQILYPERFATQGE